MQASCYLRANPPSLLSALSPNKCLAPRFLASRRPESRHENSMQHSRSSPPPSAFHQACSTTIPQPTVRSQLNPLAITSWPISISVAASYLQSLEQGPQDFLLGRVLTQRCPPSTLAPQYDIQPNLWPDRRPRLCRDEELRSPYRYGWYSLFSYFHSYRHETFVYCEGHQFNYAISTCPNATVDLPTICLPSRPRTSSRLPSPKSPFPHLLFKTFVKVMSMPRNDCIQRRETQGRPQLRLLLLYKERIYCISLAASHELTLVRITLLQRPDPTTAQTSPNSSQDNTNSDLRRVTRLQRDVSDRNHIKRMDGMRDSKQNGRRFPVYAP